MHIFKNIHHFPLLRLLVIKALFVDLYDGYNTKERTLQHRLLTIDVVGLLFAAFFLLNLMRSLSPIITNRLLLRNDNPHLIPS